MSKFRIYRNPICSRTPFNVSAPIVCKWKHSPIIPKITQKIVEESETSEMQVDRYYPPGSLQCAVLSDTRLSQVRISETDVEEDPRESYSFTDVHYFTKPNWAPTPVYVIRGATGPVFSKPQNKKLQTKGVQLFHQHPKGCQAMFQEDAGCQAALEPSCKRENRQKSSLSVVWLKKRKKPVHVMRVTEEDFKDQFTHLLIESQTTQTVMSVHTQAASTSSGLKLPCKKARQMVEGSQLICECTNKGQQVSKSDSLTALVSKIMQTEEPPTESRRSTSLTALQDAPAYMAALKKSASNQINSSNLTNDPPREMATATEDKSIHTEMDAGTGTGTGKSSSILASPIPLKMSEDPNLPETFTVAENSNNIQNTLELIESGLEDLKLKSPAKSSASRIDQVSEGKSRSNWSSKGTSGSQKKESDYLSKNIILENFIGVPDKLATVDEDGPASTVTVEDLLRAKQLDTFSNAPSKITGRTGPRKSRIERKFSEEELEVTKEHIYDTQGQSDDQTTSDIGKLDDLEEEMRSEALGPDYTLPQPRKGSYARNNTKPGVTKPYQGRNSRSPAGRFSKATTILDPYDSVSTRTNTRQNKFESDAMSKSYKRHEETTVEDDDGGYQQQKKETMQVAKTRKTITEIQTDYDSRESTPPPEPSPPPSPPKTPSPKIKCKKVASCKIKAGSNQSLTYPSNKPKCSLRYYTNKSVCRQCCRPKDKKDKGDSDDKSDDCKCTCNNKEVGLPVFVKDPSPPCPPCNCTRCNNNCGYGPNNCYNTYGRCVMPPEPNWGCNCWQGVCTTYGYCQGYYPNTTTLNQPMPGCVPRRVPNACPEPTCLIYPRSQFSSATDPCNPFRPCKY